MPVVEVPTSSKYALILLLSSEWKDWGTLENFGTNIENCLINKIIAKVAKNDRGTLLNDQLIYHINAGSVIMFQFGPEHPDFLNQFAFHL